MAGFWHEVVAMDVHSIDDCSVTRVNVYIRKLKKEWATSIVSGIRLEGGKMWTHPTPFFYGKGCQYNIQTALKDGYIYLQVRHPA